MQFLQTSREMANEAANMLLAEPITDGKTTALVVQRKGSFSTTLAEEENARRSHQENLQTECQEALLQVSPLILFQHRKAYLLCRVSSELSPRGINK